MSWCKFDDAADGEKMALAASVVGDSAVAFWFRAVLHCSRNRTDGFVDARLVARFTSHKKPLDVVAALVNAKVRPDGAGLLVPCDGGWMVHDYLAFNRSRAEAEEDDARARAEKDAARARAKAARNAKRTVYDQPVRSANVLPDIKPDETVPYENVPRGGTRASPVPSRPVPSQTLESPGEVSAPRREIQTPALDPHTQARIAYTEAVSVAVGRLWSGIAGFAEEDAAVAALLADATAEHTAEFGALDMPRFLDKLSENVARWVREERAAGREKFTRGWRPTKFVEWLAAQDAAQAAPAPVQSRWGPPTDAELGLATAKPATGLLGAPDQRVDH